MALFGSKKNTAKKETAEKAVVVSSATKASARDLSHIIRTPRVTEKASIMAEKGVYVFEVSQNSTKTTIAKAVQELYNVVPVRVAITPIPDKKIQARGGWGIKRGGKKAYVYLKKGQTIEFV